jgi:hypothetical protein
MKTLYRKTGSFSLEEAARIRQAIETAGAAQCPACRMPLSRLVGENGRGDVWLLRCKGCGRSLVLREVTALRAQGENWDAAVTTP